MPFPTNREQARLWSAYNNIDWIRPIKYPPGIQHIILKRQISQYEGYALFIFLFGNGMDPNKAQQILVDFHNYNAYQANYLKIKALDGRLQGKYYDMHLKIMQNV